MYYFILKAGDDDAYSIAQGRSRRQKADKKGRLSAFEKLRQAKEKGIKNKYEVEDEKNVYDIVEENEYSELVRQRQEDDWIVDDGTNDKNCLLVSVLNASTLSCIFLP